MNQIVSEPHPLSQDTRLIPLTQGQFALVDAADYDWLMQWKWCAAWNPNTRSYYAKRNTPRVNGKQDSIWMARSILGLDQNDSRIADHITHQTLDNRHVNLRVVTGSQSVMNRRLPRNNTSGFKGVVLDKRTGRWRAQIYFERKRISLGFFSNPEHAHAIYQKAALRYFGQYACMG